MELHLKRDISEKVYQEAKIGSLKQADIISMIADPDAVELKEAYMKNL
jgi:hypothetical protein